MATEPPTKGTLIEVWAVTPVDEHGLIYGVFLNRAMAEDYITNEPPRLECAATRRKAFKWDDSDRVSLFDEQQFGPFELSTEYTSEPLRREKELRAQALAKLTDEERKALGYPSSLR